MNRIPPNFGIRTTRVYTPSSRSPFYKKTDEASKKRILFSPVVDNHSNQKESQEIDEYKMSFSSFRSLQPKPKLYAKEVIRNPGYFSVVMSFIWRLFSRLFKS